MQKDQDAQDEQILVYSDIEDQLNPQPNLEKEKGQIQRDQMKLRRLQNGAIQLLYIMFTFYRKQLQTITINYGCEMRISMNTYFVRCRDDKKESQFNQCLNKISQFAKSINYIQLLTAPNTRDAFKYRNSPYINSSYLVMNSKNINMLSFNKKVYGISRASKEIIKEQFVKIIKRYLIFTVKFCSTVPNRPFGSFNYLLKLHFIFSKHLLIILSFSRKEISSQNSNHDRYNINMIGQRQKYLMQSKHTLKNVLESLVCIIVRNTKINEKTLIKFLQKAAGYPIHFARYRNKSIVMISKDNILKQIQKKSQNIMKYIGFDQQNNQINQYGSHPEIGIYVVNSNSFESKIKNLRASIINKGFDIYTNM